MTTINLKDFYTWYTHDEYIEVSDEVAAELRADKLYELAHQRRITRNKVQYSLDCDDGIEYSACLSEPTPQELLERMERFYICGTLSILCPRHRAAVWMLASLRARAIARLRWKRAWMKALFGGPWNVAWRI